MAICSSRNCCRAACTACSKSSRAGSSSSTTSRLIGDVKLGTVLTATATTTTQPVTVRTATVTNGTVWWAQGNYVVLTLENGQNRAYTVPESFRFTVEGKPASVHELKKGMKVSATKIVEEPRTEIATKTVITGKGPAK